MLWKCMHSPRPWLLTPSSSSRISLPMAARVVHLQLDWAFTAHLLWALNLHTTTNRINHHWDIQWVRTNNICSTSYSVSYLRSCDSRDFGQTQLNAKNCFAFKHTVVNSDQLWVILKYWPCPCWNHDFWFIRTKRIENYRVLCIMVFFTTTFTVQL